VSEGLIASTMMVGQALAFAPNYNAAKVSSARIFKLLDRKTKIDSASSAGQLPVSKQTKPTLFKECLFVINQERYRLN
jgi:hypothetical protein